MLSAEAVISFATTALPEAALAFYRDVLGFSLIDDSPFALVFDLGGGRMLRVQKLQHHAPVGYTVLGWGVGDIAGVVSALTAKGVAFNRYDGLGQDADGIWHSPSGDRVAWFTDPDGNVLSLTQFAA
jgi:catechol 2,3-dioxygenase-like lactoylglutathione lyase family enzyme